MKSTVLGLDGLLMLEPRIFSDERGTFSESHNEKQFAELIGQDRRFVQDNHSTSRSGVLRGLHYQLAPSEQGKLVRAIRGAIYDVAVDIRPDSRTFGRWSGSMLSAENRKQLWIPPGFAHGFLALTDCDVLYKTDAYYEPALERSIRWDDETIAISWPLTGVPIVSAKDQVASTLAQLSEQLATTPVPSMYSA